MNKFITIMFSLFAMIVLPSIAYAQPYHGAYHIIEMCYTVLFPYPHSRCEYVQVRHNYAPIIPHHHSYRPLPQPAPRHWHHPPHHNHNGHRR